MNYVKVFGIERSGTSFIQALIRQNLRNTLAMSNGFGWKHGEIREPLDWLNNHHESSQFFWDIYNEKKEGGISSVIIIKNPYNWFNSIERYSKRYTGYKPFNPEWQYQRYNKLYLHWYYELIQLKNPWFSSCLIVRYEDLLSHPKRELQRIAKMVGTPLKEKLSIPNKVEMSAPFNEKRKLNYLNGIQLSGRRVGMINGILDDQIFKIYGYAKRK